MPYPRLLMMLFLAIGVILLGFFRQDFFIQLQLNLDDLPFIAAVSLFSLLFILGSILLLPNSLFMISGGLLFGLHWGFVLNLISFTLACAAAFLISRYLAYDYVRSHTPEKTRHILQRVKFGGWKLVAILRLLAPLPAFTINYSLGITPISFRGYLWASAFFTVPNCLLFTYAGVAGEQLINGGGKFQIYLAASLFIISAFILTYFRKRLFSPN